MRDDDKSMDGMTDETWILNGPEVTLGGRTKANPRLVLSHLSHSLTL